MTLFSASAVLERKAQRWRAIAARIRLMSENSTYHRTLLATSSELLGAACRLASRLPDYEKNGAMLQDVYCYKNNAAGYRAMLMNDVEKILDIILHTSVSENLWRDDICGELLQTVRDDYARYCWAFGKIGEE